MERDSPMLTNKLCVALICAAVMSPAGARLPGQPADADSEFVATPLGRAIASQGNQALRTIRSEARLCLRSQKPVPLDSMIRDVSRQAAPDRSTQEL